MFRQIPLKLFLDAQINNGVYKSGFSTSQGAYDRAQAELYEALDVMELRLSQHRFLLGDRYTLRITAGLSKLAFSLFSCLICSALAFSGRVRTAIYASEAGICKACIFF